MTTTNKPRDILDRVSAYIIFHGATPVASSGAVTSAGALTGVTSDGAS